jgi:hypothetical protein
VGVAVEGAVAAHGGCWGGGGGGLLGLLWGGGKWGVGGLTLLVHEVEGVGELHAAVGGAVECYVASVLDEG